MQHLQAAAEPISVDLELLGSAAAVLELHMMPFSRWSSKPHGEGAVTTTPHGFADAWYKDLLVTFLCSVGAEGALPSRVKYYALLIWGASESLHSPVVRNRSPACFADGH